MFNSADRQLHADRLRDGWLHSGTELSEQPQLEATYWEVTGNGWEQGSQVEERMWSSPVLSVILNSYRK